MIDYYLLEELATFGEMKTLAKTAEALSITQPTVTRGMQKLEEQMGVKLFDRQPNRIALTATGQMAVKGARELVDATQDFVMRVRNFDQSQQVIKIASIAPGPIYVANRLAESFRVQVERTFVAQDDIPAALVNHDCSLCFTNREIQTDDVESLYIGEERLNVNLDKFMYLAGKQHVTFDELRGLSFVVLDDIGPWKKIIHDNIPDAKFLYQDDYDALREITRYASFPYFTTNVTELMARPADDDNDRV